MIRTGEQYRESLRDGRQVWINGEKVKDVTVHPAFKPIVDVRARIYDMAHDAKTRDLMSYVDKDSNLFRVLTSAGITLQHEIDLLKLTRELDMVSVGLAFDEEDSLRVVGEVLLRGLDLVLMLAVEGVEHLGPVHGQIGDGPFALVDHVVVRSRHR